MFSILLRGCSLGSLFIILVHVSTPPAKYMKKLPGIILLLFVAISGNAQPTTYCNPINLDYGYTPIPNFSTWGKHRATADPVIVNYKGTYYLFSTNQWDHW